MNTCINCHSDYEIKEGLLKNKCEKCSIMLRKKDKKIAQRRKEEGYFKTPEYKATHKKYEKNNKEYLQERRSKYYLANKDKLELIVECQFCNSLIRKDSLKRHYKTKKCIACQPTKLKQGK